MNVEESRLSTFAEWPENAAVNSSRMAKGGFYYTGHNTEVQCFLCGIVISDWNYGDQVMVRHRQAKPDCPFVLDPSTTCNVPMVEISDNIRAQPLSQSPIPPPRRRRRSSENLQLGRIPVVLSQNPRLEYGTYEQRLSSFQNWPLTAEASPESLARAGFYYLQQEDMVQCVYCKGIMRMWEPHDDPETQHRIGFPECDFYLHRDCNSAVTTIEKEKLANFELLSGTPSDLHKLGIQKHSAPKGMKYATYESRLRSFQGWPENLHQTPEMLVMAGFYYTGTGDQVRCFHCDGGLNNWEADDDPWTEHARWFPKCGFVSIIRGQDFIQYCLDNRPPLDPMIFLGVPEDGETTSSTLHSTNAESNANSSSAVASSQNSNSNPITREVTDAEVEELLHSAPAITALQIGLNLGRVKTALRQRIERFGVPYTNADQLIEHVRRIHLSEENNGFEIDQEPSADLANLLNQVITKQSLNRSRPLPPVTNGSSSRTKTAMMSDVKDEQSPKNSDKDEKSRNNPVDGPLSLEEENRRLREARLCKICMDREVSVVFLPCGHLATCVHCTPSLRDCPMCRQEIRAIVRTFLA